MSPLFFALSRRHPVYFPKACQPMKRNVEESSKSSDDILSRKAGKQKEYCGNTMKWLALPHLTMALGNRYRRRPSVEDQIEEFKASCPTVKNVLFHSKVRYALVVDDKVFCDMQYQGNQAKRLSLERADDVGPWAMASLAGSISILEAAVGLDVFFCCAPSNIDLLFEKYTNEGEDIYVCIARANYDKGLAIASFLLSKTFGCRLHLHVLDLTDLVE
jgi:hypothetical protein